MCQSFLHDSMQCLYAIDPVYSGVRKSVCTHSQPLYPSVVSLVTEAVACRLSKRTSLRIFLTGLESSSLPLITLEASVGIVHDQTNVSFISPFENVLAHALFMFWHHDFCFFVLCVCVFVFFLSFFAATGCSHYGVLCSGSWAGRPGWDVLQQLFPLCAVSAGPGPFQCPQPVGAQWETGAGAIRRPSGTVTARPPPRYNPSAQHGLPAQPSLQLIASSPCMRRAEIIKSKKRAKGIL